MLRPAMLHPACMHVTVEGHWHGVRRVCTSTSLGSTLKEEKARLLDSTSSSAASPRRMTLYLAPPETTSFNCPCPLPAMFLPPMPPGHTVPQKRISAWHSAMLTADGAARPLRCERRWHHPPAAAARAPSRLNRHQHCQHQGMKVKQAYPCRSCYGGAHPRAPD